MKCRNIDLIEFRSDSIKPAPKFRKIKNVIALDTETRDGTCFLLGWYKDENMNGIIRITNIARALTFLLSHQLIRAYLFCYNLTFDAQAIIKLMPYDIIKNLASIGEADCTIDNVTYTIRYIPGKLLKVSNGKRSVKIYDIAQFFKDEKGGMKLDNVAEHHLGVKKVDIKSEGVDITALDPKRYDDDRAYKEILDKYLIQDCRLTAQLARKVISLTSPYIIPKFFYSNASFSQQYFLENLNHKMRLPPRPVLQYALMAYQGGRFETFKRGYFPDAYIYDIKSAYPFHNIELPDTGKGRWQFTNKYDPHALLSILKVRFSLPEMPIMPTKHQHKNGLIVYPYGDFAEMYINKDEFELISLYTSIHVLGAWHYYDAHPDYPYSWLKRMFDMKELFKSQGNKDLAMIPKTMMNGFYGKTIQINPITQVNTEKLPTEYDSMLVDIIILKNAQGVNKLHYVYRKYRAGALFNPVIANEITARTRVQLFKSCMHQMTDVIAFQTDSIMSSAPIPDINLGSDIGYWELENQGDMIMLGSGVYSMPGRKSRLRGLEKGMDLNTVLHSYPPESTQIMLSLQRNTKLKRIMTMKYADNQARIDALNLIIPAERAININFDTKREWARPFKDINDVMTNTIESKPLKI